ncbi:fungal specific transcription factor domain-containing protein [Colletotrichum abscissum]|uniref:Fungal specific transcription factor domain-containing protein n=1 Tax=Colletotrichum abscissum TaxID=1671311 RepID=A0A9P9X172_9PEZI|nr:fungal specific transcription factor domain-containing protein [Colletotrichum abscissum]
MTESMDRAITPGDVRAAALTYLSVLEKQYPDSFVVGGSTKFSENGGVSFETNRDPVVMRAARALCGGSCETWNCSELVFAVLGHISLWKEKGLEGQVLSPVDLNTARIRLFGEGVPSKPVTYALLRKLLSGRDLLRVTALSAVRPSTVQSPGITSWLLAHQIVNNCSAARVTLPGLPSAAGVSY